MASTVLTIVGRSVGNFYGGAIGAELGARIGGALGSKIDSGGNGNKKFYEGARLENLAVQSSTYGRMIPLVFGTVRIGGNVLWSRPIKEVVTTTTVSSGGGKGGGGGKKSSSSSTTTQYSYYVTLAIAVCEGEVTRVDRVWADAKLLDLSLGSYRMYKGTETQLPDPLIESYQGVGATPAYRGTAYVVIEDFPLADYGNRIPNFTFEVTRRTSQGDSDGTPVESLVKSIMLIPGSGEFVYDTTPAFKISGTDASGNFVQNGYQISLNQHTADGRANVLLALDQLQQTFPNLEWVGVTVNWFGTSMNIAGCEVFPCVEYQAGVQTTPDNWNVAGYSRASARQISYDAGVSRYGGTPDDDSIVHLVTELRARGLKIFFYPMMLMDVAGKPWRGEVTGAASAVSGFFTGTNGYNRFITHYANLLVGKVDAFAIGTELKGITAITSSAGVFPAVSQLVSLASSVKTILGSSVKITYAADWSEYHHTDGGWYHLDPLWASSSIDMVGIDAYFPLTDAVQTGYDIDALKTGWVSGEHYDWIYTDSSRTTQMAVAPAYALKNISWWWNNTHTNPGGGTSAWVPGSKPIWFTEYGFPSVDGAANEPNVFVDASASSSALPRFSRGRVDFMAQRVAIAATEAQWAGSGMVANKFLWTWDARPYPYWPDLTSVWADGANWVTGHWVQGKLGASHVAAAVEELAVRAGLTNAQIDSSKLQMLLDGFVVHERVSARAAMQQLMQAFFFSIKETAGALVAMPRDASTDATVVASECVLQKAGALEVPYVLKRQEDLVLPDRVELQYLDRLKSYNTNVQGASRSIQSATDTQTVAVSLVISDTHARAIAETLLADRWAERSSIEFQLPMRYAALEPGDLVSFSDGAKNYSIRLAQVQVGKPGMVRIKGVLDAAEVWDGYIAPTLGSDGATVAPIPETRLEVLDIPALPGEVADALTVRFAAVGLGDGWTGATVIRDEVSGNDQELVDITSAATIGSALNVLPSGVTQVFDRVNTVDIALIGDATLNNATELAVLNGANVAVLGSEVIQFTTVTSLAAGIYRLSGLLRGRLGTEAAIGSHAVNERFVLLDNAVQAVTLPLTSYQQTWNLRAPSFGTSLASGAAQSVTIAANSLKPYSPVLLKAVRDVGTGDVTLSWVRRARIDNGLRDTVEIPLMEHSEQYDVAVLSGSTVLRSWRVTTPSIVYVNAEQITDFGSLPATLSLRVTQLSSLVGLGTPASANVVVV